MKLIDRINKSLGTNRAVMALSLARMADAMGNSILIILIPIYIAKLPHEMLPFAVPILVGILISAFGLVTSFFQPLMGALSDRLGRRKPLIIIGLAIIGISTFAFIFANDFMDLLLLRILQAVGVALTIPASLSLMTAVTHRSSRGGSMGVYSTFRMIGFAIGPITGGFIQVHYGFNAAFYVGAGLIFLAIIFVEIWVDEVRMEDTGDGANRFKVFDLSLFSSGILSAASATFAMACAFSMITTLENEFNSRLNITAFGFSVAFSMLMVGRLLFQVPLGKYSDYIGRKPIILVGLILMGIATALLGEATSIVHLVILRLAQGIAAAGVAAPAFAIAADLSKTGGEGRQMSVITMGFTMGIALGPLLAGVLSISFFELPFLTIGSFCLISAWIVYRYMPETMKGDAVIFKSPAHQKTKVCHEH